MASPFDFLKSINETKVDIVEAGEANIEEYDPFIVNRGLSYFLDTLFHANEMNRYHQLPKDMQYKYLLLTVSKKKRFSKWAKAERGEDFLAVQWYYNVNVRKAEEIVKVLKPEHIEQIIMLYKEVV